jgi:transposase, IS5 family
VSVATTVKHSAGGQFVAHAAALPGNPYDGHTLSTVIPQMQALIGNVLDRCITDAGYRGHNAPPDHKFKVYTSGQKRRLTPQIKREFKRRAAIEREVRVDDSAARGYAPRERDHQWGAHGRRDFTPNFW